MSEQEVGQGNKGQSAEEIKAQEVVREKQKALEDAEKAERVHAVIGFTIPPQGVKFLGSVIRQDINGQVIVFESDAERQNTAWKSNDNKIIACPSMIMRAESVPELQKLAHELVDKVIASWYQAQGIKPPITPEVMPNEPELPSEPVVHENQSPSEALDSIVKDASKEEQAEPEGQTLTEEPPAPTKTVELNVVSSMAESKAEPN